MIWKRIKTKYRKVDHPSRAANKHRYPRGAHDKFSPIHSTVVQFTSSIVYLVHINYTSTDFQLASISRKQVLTSMQLRRSSFPPTFPEIQTRDIPSNLHEKQVLNRLPFIYSEMIILTKREEKNEKTYICEGISSVYRQNLNFVLFK